MKEKYHHGNLRGELLEAAIAIISQEGFEQVSLRRIAAQCGVSHNAAYRHFANKEQLIDSCRAYVTQLLTEYLYQEIAAQTDALERLETVCHAYVQFYREHPTYFSGLYRNAPMPITLTLEEQADNYPPFVLFQQCFLAYAEEKDVPQEERLDKLVYVWSLLHGRTAMEISPNVRWDETPREDFGALRL